jgi:hypothetical protein
MALVVLAVMIKMLLGLVMEPASLLDYGGEM